MRCMKPLCPSPYLFSDRSSARFILFPFLGCVKYNNAIFMIAHSYKSPKKHHEN